MKVLLANSSSLEISGFKKHAHPCWEIVIPISGSGDVYNEKESIHFSVGSAYVIPPNVEHTSISNCTFSDIYIHIDRLFFPADCITTAQGITELPHLAHLLCRLWRIGADYHENSIDALINLVVSLIQENSVVDKPSALAVAVHDYIANHFSDPTLHMSELEAKFGYTADHIRRVFQREYNMSAMGYLDSKRLANAKLLLKQMPLYTIQQIALQCGFSDPLYFSRFFRRHTGSPPSVYRKNHPT